MSHPPYTFRSWDFRFDHPDEHTYTPEDLPSEPNCAGSHSLPTRETANSVRGAVQPTGVPRCAQTQRGRDTSIGFALQKATIEGGKRTSLQLSSLRTRRRPRVLVAVRGPDHTYHRTVPRGLYRRSNCQGEGDGHHDDSEP
jgi:hypothetical protein